MSRKLLMIGTIFFTIGTTPFFSCQNHTSNTPNSSATTPNASARDSSQRETILPRNTKIDPAHAYSDLFLDSSDLIDFITRQRLNDTLAAELQSLYNARNFQFAWFTQDGLTEQALAFSSLYQYSKDTSTGRKWLDRRLDTLQSTESGQLSAADPVLKKTEMLMSWRFMNYLNDRYPDKKLRMTAFLQLIPVEKRDPLEMAHSTLAQTGKGSPNPWYQALDGQLQKYLDWQQAGGWERLRGTHRSYKPGDSAAFITAVKKRLLFTREMPGSDTGKLFDKDLETTIKSFQSTHGLTPDGKIGPAVIKELNIPVLARIKQILINLERMRWMPAGSDKQLIIINIPDFRLQILDGGHPVMAMNVVVGKEGHSTVLFSGRLDRIIFNPYWNIPPSIVKKEILPAMEKNKHYLGEHDMEITGQEKGLPVIRQVPGDKNELGRIKFLFPNSFNIYLHDSPHKELFSRTRRAYSHGCIRVADAQGLAAWLLRDTPEWSKEKIAEVIDAGKEKSVGLENPIAVLIVYYTAWVDEEKKLQFREDIYGHDSAVAHRFFLQ